MQGLLDLHGSSAPASSVVVVNAAGEPIGRAVADDDGQWRIKGVALPIGEHWIRAKAELASGEKESQPLRVVVTEPIDVIHAEEPAPSPEAIDRYVTLARAVAAGFEIDDGTLTAACAAVDRSAEEFQDDVEFLQTDSAALA